MASSSSSGSKKMIVLRSGDKEEFEVEEVVAIQSQVIKSFIEEREGAADYDDKPFLLPEVNGKNLAKVLEFCKKHASPDLNPEELKAWESTFVDGFEPPKLFELIEAANYLNIKPLLDVACQKVVDSMIHGKTTEELRQTFNIANDFTPEEEERIRKENEWTFGFKK